MLRYFFRLLTSMCIFIICINIKVKSEELCFENSVVEATGFSSYSMGLKEYADYNSNTIEELVEGSKFTIKEVNDDWWKVITENGSIGFLDSNYCLINLPDVLPSIKYNIVNAEGAIYKSSGYSLGGVTGEKLYDIEKVYNERLDRKEYYVPICYTFATILGRVELKLKELGYTLVIYDAYRPVSVSRKIRDSLNALYSENEEVRNGINNGEGGYYWGTGWFLAQNISAHNLCCAVDVSIENDLSEELEMPSSMHELSVKAIKYVNPSTSRVSREGYSQNMTDGAIFLNNVFLDEGAEGLASEWWHFQDNESLSRMLSVSGGMNFLP